MIGASGAISGILRAYLVLHPRPQALVLAFMYIPVRLPAGRRRARGLHEQAPLERVRADAAGHGRMRRRVGADPLPRRHRMPAVAQAVPVLHSRVVGIAERVRPCTAQVSFVRRRGGEVTE